MNVVFCACSRTIQHCCVAGARTYGHARITPALGTCWAAREAKMLLGELRLRSQFSSEIRISSVNFDRDL